MSRSRLVPLLVALSLASVAVSSGCLASDGAKDPGADGADATPPSRARDAATGTGPAAPTTAYAVGDAGASTTIYPYLVAGQEARAPETVDASGAFAPQDCMLGPAQDFLGEEKFVDLGDVLRPGDAVEMVATLAFTNSEASWADLRLWIALPGQNIYWEPSVADARGEVVQSFTAQFGFAGGPEDGVFAGVDCWDALHVEDFPFTLTMTLTFAEGVVPGATPHLVKVSPNVTELRVAGAPLAPGGEVTGHYRVFNPDDTLLGEFALNSDEAFDAVPVAEPGDYVIIVDHSEGGMLALGANAPPADNALVPLGAAWTMARVWASDAPGSHTAALTIDVPRVPLFIVPVFVAGEAGPSGGKKILSVLESTRGVVWHRQIAGEVGVRAPSFYEEVGVPGVVDGWDYRYDHHALAQGEHTLTITCDLCHGEFHVAYQTYLRPGEPEPPTPAPQGFALALPRLA